MKTLLIGLLSCAFTCATAQTGKYVNAYEVTFPGKYVEQVIIRDDPSTVARNHIDINAIRFAGYFGGEESGVWGPFNLSGNYARLFNGNDQFLMTALNVALVDVARSEYYRGERRLLRIHAESFYNHSLLDWEKRKSKRLSFYNPAMQSSTANVNLANVVTVHVVKLPIMIHRQLALRGGIMYHQRSVANNSLDAILAENAYEQDDTISNIYGTRNMTFGAGITLNRIMSVGYESQGFGTKTAYFFGNSYVDLLVSPVTAIYKSVYEVSDDFEEIGHGKTGEVDDQVSMIGFRIGFSKRASLIRASKFGSTMGIEGGILPGLKSGNGYVMVNFGWGWGF